jgi:hypothetical protein
MPNMFKFILRPKHLIQFIMLLQHLFDIVLDLQLPVSITTKDLSSNDKLHLNNVVSSTPVTTIKSRSNWTFSYFHDFIVVTHLTMNWIRTQIFSGDRHR